MSGSDSEAAEEDPDGQDETSTPSQGPTLLAQSDDRKRKLDSSAQPSTIAPATAKKARCTESASALPTSPELHRSDKSHLPPEIWHRVFTFLPPKALGTLLCCNKLFNAYLDPSSAFACPCPVSQQPSHVPVLKPNAIWQASRRRFWCKMPTPLQGKSELDMWRLVCQKQCHFCGKTASSFTEPRPTDPWRNGPGYDGTRIAWPFALKSCGSCLEKKTDKEIDLLLSPMPSILLPALPFVLVTEDMHLVLSTVLQSGQAPQISKVNKIFYAAHVVAIKEEFASVKSMGGATAEEWIKGLEARGKEHRSDAMRWEKWELSGGIVQMQNEQGLDVSRTTSATGTEPPGRKPAILNGQLPEQPSAGRSPQENNPAKQRMVPARQEDHPRPIAPVQHGRQPNPSRNRTIEEVFELQANRRAEIERRANELDPPLPVNILAHIPSFQAAIQIAAPLDDSAWELLKPRLLAQRADAEEWEKREQEIAALRHNEQLQSQDRRTTRATNLEAKQLADRDWDDVQAPLRARISAYADDTIRESWRDARKVNKENAPQFAAEVLVSVRRRFYNEAAKDALARRAAGQAPVADPPQGPFTQKLTLENMKWLFDVKIKPHTEPFRKEIFYCNGCESHTKVYGFEGVVQHYAAKHTSILSQGSVVVHWRAEWPEVPPFHPDPRALKNSTNSQPIPPLPAQSHSTMASRPTAQPAPYPPSPYSHTPAIHHGQPPNGKAYNTAATRNPYSQHAPYAPPQLGYGQPFNPYVHPHASQDSRVGDLSVPYGPQPGMMAARSSTGPSATGQASGPYYGTNFTNNAQHVFQSANPGNSMERYRAQLEDVARNSRELWMITASVKDLPGNIRVGVVLHHVASRFRSRFFESPPLSLFMEGLSNNKDMRPVRNVNGLMCKACNLGLGGAIPAEHERKTFSLPQLVNHFAQRHLEHAHQVGSPPLDWSVDMVYVPNLSILSNLRNMKNMDNHKFALISDAFPPGNQPDGHPQPQTAPAQPIWPLAQTGGYSGAPAPYGQYEANASYSASRYGSAAPHAGYEPDQMVAGPFHTSGPPSLDPQSKDNHHSGPAHEPPSTAAVDHGAFRSGPNAWQPSSEARARNRKDSYKERKDAPAQGRKARKAARRSRASNEKTREPSEEDIVAEEEARRQEEEIRAMWAADRKEAARVASVSQVPEAREEPEVLTIPENAADRWPRKNEGFVQNSHRAQDYRQAVVLPDRNEDDLMAGLESQLDQQASSERLGSQPSISTANPYQQLPQRVEHPFAEDYRGYRARSRTPIGRAASRPPPVYYRDRSPYSPRSTMPVYETRPAHVPRDTAVYDGAPRQEVVYADEYEVAEGGRALPQQVEAYELIPMRDSQGEYYIRRPVRYEQEAVAYVTYDDDRTARRLAYARETSSRPYMYEPAPPSGAAHQFPSNGYRPSSVARRQSYGALSRDDPAAYEEYDPRFPAAPATPSTTSPRFAGLE
ncbi:hypothetical protein F4780DRAFT_768359 [Xylariomycetidae sp. FL0641]|nr:hypothetical protein F4780DRAFT_768359 [Xylariomycetidae sp. FL0641]